jgi:hypothetical protein
VREQLVDGGIDKPHELDLRHGLQAVHRHTDGGADYARLREVSRLVRAEEIKQPVGYPEYPAVLSHVLTQDDHVLSRSISSRSARLRAWTMFIVAISKSFSCLDSL